jgi:hypothetical protein
MARTKRVIVGSDPVHVNVRMEIEGDWKRYPLGAVEGISRGISILEETLTEAVDAAREQGCSWAEIGEKLGVTRQAAWDRFSSR